MAQNKVNRILSELRDRETVKGPWLPLYQQLAEVYLTRNADFTRSATPAEFLLDNVFSNVPQFSAHVSASVFLAMLWPDSARTFRLKAVSQLEGLPGVEEFFRACTKEMHTKLDKPKAGLQLALMSHFLDELVFGISGIGTFDGPEGSADLPVVFEHWDAKSMYVSENAQGFVTSIFLKLNKTVRQIVEEYGTGRPGDNVSAAVMEKYKEKKFEEKVEMVKVLEPKDPEANKKGVAAMKYRSIHIDIDNRMVLRESGFREMPVAIGRLFKRAEETQGRSSGMVGLPASNSLNALTEAILVATEKNLDPPLMISDDARLGGGVVDTSASAINVVNMSGRLGAQKPIEPMFTVGEMNTSKDLKAQLIEEVTQAFFLDRLLDLNNKVPMTAFETSIRNRLRGESVGSILGRQYTEVITPTIHRAFKTMNRRGHFGLINKGPGAVEREKWIEITGKKGIIVPDSVQKAFDMGLTIYEIEYISPASRFMRAEKLQGLFTAVDSVAALAAVFPSIVHGVDPDQLRRDIYEFSGAPIGSLRTDDETKAARAEDAKRQEQVNALEAGEQMANIQGKSAAARAALGTIPK